MLSELYEFYRGASGFSLLLGGLTLALTRPLNPLNRSFGQVLFSAGFLFTLSALDPIIKLPLDLGNFLTLGGLYFISVCFHHFLTELFGGPRDPKVIKLFRTASAIWTLLLFALPFLDYILALPIVKVSLEDGHQLGPFHNFTYHGAYLLPLVSPVLALWTSKWNIKDLKDALPSLGASIPGAGLVAVVIVFILASLGSPGPFWYRVGHTVLQTALLGWYFLIHTHPQLFRVVQSTIEVSHQHNEGLAPDELALIKRRFERISDLDGLIQDPELTLPLLAEQIGLPPYRLSLYFNKHLKSSFPEWINRERIQRICRLIKENPELSLLEISLQAGYQSKSAFNAQFKKICGMSPSEWKRFHQDTGDTSIP